MSHALFKRGAPLALVVVIVAIVVVVLATSGGNGSSHGAVATRSAAVTRTTTTASGVLPPGCDLQYGGQLVSAFTHRPQRFGFDGYNAVPPGDSPTDIRISWGDGTSSKGTSAAHRAPERKGCEDTVFSGRHTYAHTACRTRPAKGPCMALYEVTVSYRDAETNTAGKLDKLRVYVVER